MSQSTEHYEKLLQKYLDGQCDAAETAALCNWLQSSDSHRSLLATMQREFEQAMNTHHEIPAEVSDRIENRLLSDITRHKVVKFHAWRWAAAAAVVLLLAGVWFMNRNNTLQQNPLADNHVKCADVPPGSNKATLTLANGDTVTLDSTGNQVITQGKTLVHQRNGQLQYAVQSQGDAVVYNTLTVPRGGQFNIVLPDGSHVWLNAASSLKYPTAFNGARRTVEIQGQGYFEVSPNSRQPFSVKVNDMEVQVLGTSFDVMAYADENTINTTLINGSVNILHGSEQHLLRPGYQAMMNASTGAMTIHPADVDQVIAWKTGFFEFDNAHLADILRQLSRWYDIDISYSQIDNNKLFGGRISRSLPLSDILHMLEANGPKFLLTGRKLIVK